MDKCLSCGSKLDSIANVRGFKVCNKCYLEEIGLSENDLMDNVSMLYIEVLNSPIEFEMFFRYSLDRIKTYLESKNRG